MWINRALCAQRLAGADKILILTHKDPDGDTLGSAFGLCKALSSMGKMARVECPDPLPARYDYMYPEDENDFIPEYIVSVDVADDKLLGRLWDQVRGINLCIDHHPSNTDYAEETLVDAECSATAELVFEIINEMKLSISPAIATALYTGISSDTGSFIHQNTTAKSFTIAGKLLELGADNALVNTRLFGQKSRAMLWAQSMATADMSYFLDGKCAMIKITRALLASTGATDEELDGISDIPRKVEGVEVGVVVRERADNVTRLSLRSSNGADVSAVCRKLGGGGHVRAAGCTLYIPMEEAERVVIEAIEEELRLKKLL